MSAFKVIVVDDAVAAIARMGNLGIPFIGAIDQFHRNYGDCDGRSNSHSSKT